MNTTNIEEGLSGVAHVDPNTPIEEILAIFKRDGAVIIDDLADKDTVAAIREELDELIEQALGQNEDWDEEQIETYGEREALVGVKTARPNACLTRVPACRPLPIHPKMLELMSHIFETGFQLNSTQAMSVQPGETAQPLHRDGIIWRTTLPLPADFEIMVTCLWAIENFTAEAGATRVVPRSSDLPDSQFGEMQYDKYGEVTLPDGTTSPNHKVVPAEMSDGSVLLYSGMTYHGAGANETPDKRRTLMGVSYTCDALRQQENQYLVTPPEVAREFPEALQKLIGYEMGGGGFAGFVQDMKSPMELLK